MHDLVTWIASNMPFPLRLIVQSRNRYLDFLASCSTGIVFVIGQTTTLGKSSFSVCSGRAGADA